MKLTKKQQERMEESHLEWATQMYEINIAKTPDYKKQIPRLGIASYTAGYQAAIADENKRAQCLRDALNWEPVMCPACSIDDPPEYVPCYCFEDWNTWKYNAKQALAEYLEDK